MKKKHKDWQERIDAVIDKINAGELKEGNSVDAFYEAHYGKSRPDRVPAVSMVSGDDIVNFNEAYEGYGFMPDFQMIVTVRHGKITVIEETEKAVKISGVLTIGEIAYAMLSRWVPKKALVFKD